MRRPILERARKRGLHGHKHIDRQRLTALLMIATGIARVLLWLTITIAYVAGSATVHHWFASVSFVALLSILALLLTDWGQVAASLAQLAGAEAHHDAEHNRVVIDRDYRAIERLIRRAAEEPPGMKAKTLAEQAIGELKGGK